MQIRWPKHAATLVRCCPAVVMAALVAAPLAGVDRSNASKSRLGQDKPDADSTGRATTRTSVECDTCDEACELSVSPFTGASNVGATDDELVPSSTAAGSADIWFKYTVTGTGGRVLIHTCGTYHHQEGGFDSILTVYGAPCSEHVHWHLRDERACDDDCTSLGDDPPAPCRDENQTGFGDTRDACVCVNAQQGETLYIKVEGFAGATGGVAISAEETSNGCTPPSTGACCLTGGICESHMTESACAGYWDFAEWKEGLDCPPDVPENPCTSLKGCCCYAPGEPVEFATQQECVPRGNWHRPDPPPTDPTDCDHFDCDWVANDNCENAVPILDEAPNPLEYPWTWTSTDTWNENSTYIDDDVRFCGTTVPGRVVWYTVNGYEVEGSDPIGHWVTATTCTDESLEAPFDTVIQVYCMSGCDLGAAECCEKRLMCVAGNDDYQPDAGEPSCDLLAQGDNLGSKVRWCAHPDATYYIAVGGYGGASGQYILTITDEPPEEPSDGCEPAVTCAGTGACCLSDGTCDAGTESEPMTKAECNRQDGTFHEDLLCVEVHCRGACCVPGDGDPPDPRYCDPFKTTPAECEEVSGARFYSGQSCPGFDCPKCGDEDIDAPYEECDPPDTGMCDSDCQFIFDPAVCSDPSTPVECCQAHDAPGCLADEGSCCNSVCRQDPYCCNERWDDVCAELALVTDACQSCAGACCEPQTQYPVCYASRKVDCEDSGHVFYGPGTTCASDPCATGACCDDEGTCTETDRTDCISQGHFVGWGTSCNGEDCLRACCVSGTCSMTTQAGCTALQGSFESDETACFPNPCPEEPPVNDECEWAQEIVVGSGWTVVDVDNRAATSSEDDAPLFCHWAEHADSSNATAKGKHTVWYYFTATSTKTICIRTCNTDVTEDAAVDTIVGLYKQSSAQPGCPATSQRMACGEDGCDEAGAQNPSYHTKFCHKGLNDGTTYVIQLATSPGRPGARPGNIRLEVTADDDDSCGVCCYPYNENGERCPRWPQGNNPRARYMSKAECDAMFGTFLDGPGATCDDCNDLYETRNWGACCFWPLEAPNPPPPEPTEATCQDELDKGACDDREGIFHGLSTICPDEGSICPPSNDRCEYAVEWPLPNTCSPGDPSLVEVTDNTWASPIHAPPGEPDPPFSCRIPEAGQGYGTLWFTFQVPQQLAGTSVHISTCETDADTMLAAYLELDPPCDAQGQWEEVACSDDACGVGAAISLENLQQGDVYYIQLASWSPENQGAITIDVTCPPLPEERNDTCANALTGTLPWVAEGSTVWADPSDVPPCGPETTAPGLWYKVTGTGNVLTASLCDEATDYDTRLSVYCGACANLICVADNDDSEACEVDELQSKVEWCSAVGVDYWILVHGFGTAAGDFKLTFSEGGECDLPACKPPDNDDCADASPIALGTTSFSTIHAATYEHPPGHSLDDCPLGGEIYRDIWFNYTATCTGDLTGTGNLIVSLCGTADYDTNLAVYDGCGCQGPNVPSCNDDASGCAGYTSKITVPVLTGNCYKIRIGGFGTSDWGTGNLTLEYEEPSVPPEPPSQPNDHEGYDKVRYISFTAGNAGVSTALRVTLTDLPAPFEEFEGTECWVGEPQQVSENAGKIVHTEGWADFMSAKLDGTPYCMDWSTVGVLHVTDNDIIPDAVYDVQAVPCTCDFNNEVYYSAPLTITTSTWGDLVGTCAVLPCTAPDGIVGIPTDVTACLDKFKNLPNTVIKSRADIEPNFPDWLVNISDVTLALDAFRGFAYPAAQMPPAPGWPGPDGCSGR